MKRMKMTVVFAAAMAVTFGAEALEISKVPEGKLCALSFTYDDGVATHFTHAFPMHLKYGIPGTFLIVTDRVETDGAERARKCCSWAELKEMSVKGMEIASHTKSHRNMREIESAGVTKEMTQGKKREEVFALREKNWPELLEEVKGSKEAIEAHCGNTVRTYAFAGNACPDWSGRLMGEVGGCIRAGNIRIATGRGDTEEKYRKQFEEKILVTNRVGCVMIHGLGTKTPNDGWNPIPDLETYESLFRIVKEHAEKIHFDTFGNNAFYEMRANGVRLKKTGDGRFVLEKTPRAKASDDSGEIWIRLAPGEKASVNGKPAVPNAHGAFPVRLGDTIALQ